MTGREISSPLTAWNLIVGRSAKVQPLSLRSADGSLLSEDMSANRTERTERRFTAIR